MKSIKSSGGLTRGRGFSESTRNQWIVTAHHIAGLHDALSQLTKTQLSLSDQHVDMSDARAARDLLDVKKLSVWLKDHNQFDENDPRLKSLSLGKVSETKITCEIAEDIGKKIHKLIKNKKFYKVKIKRNDLFQCLDSK